jgi:PPOX class probable F420-dependent enzyme
MPEDSFPGSEKEPGNRTEPAKGTPLADEEELWDLVADGREGVLATLAPDGRPQLSNVLYLPDAASRLLRISTTEQRVKARNLARDPRAALHVSGDDFWHYAVAEGTAELSAVASAAGDDACRELMGVHSAMYGQLEADEFFQEMITARRLVIRLRVGHLYGLRAAGGRRPVPQADSPC